MTSIDALKDDIRACRLCKDRFAVTETGHAPRPIAWFGASAPILIAGQAPGMRVHEAQTPFWDRSGDRLRDWMGVDKDTFYDRNRISILPMAFCFPGYDAKGSDLPPPKICAATWRQRILSRLDPFRLTILIGGYAQTWHLPQAPKGVTATVAAWRAVAPEVIPLPHPSWRNTGWIKRNPWFETDLLPVLRARVAEVLA
ncbi:MAG: uracil-DNA glycosylase family protein [Pseudomonadota bacterium]